MSSFQIARTALAASIEQLRAKLLHAATASLIVSGFSCYTPAAASAAGQPQTFYVSKTGSNKDGLSYATAWSELDQIKWDKVTPGSTIVIDGGSKGATYTTPLIDDIYNPLHASGTDSAPIIIAQSTDSGHNGKVVLSGAVYGVFLRGVSHVYVFGNNTLLSQQTTTAPLRMEITKTKYFGVYVGNCNDCFLNFLEIDNNVGGLRLQQSGGTQTSRFSNLRIHDNYDNFTASGTKNSKEYANSVYGCWMYNSAPTGGNMQLATGNFDLQYCAFGPNLSTTVQGGTIEGAAGSGGNISYLQCLFLQPQIADLNLAGTGNTVKMYQITSFMTDVNQSLNARSFVSLAGSQNKLTVQASTIYGGSVLVPDGTSICPDNSNWQYKTTGYTQALGSRIADLKTQQPFVTDMSGYTNSTPSTTYQTANFSGKQGSPVPFGNSWSLQTISNLLSGLYSAP